MVTQDSTDGTPLNTGQWSDVAISQNGFFRMVDANGSVFYSRNGQFKLDENRNLANMQGLSLTGYPLPARRLRSKTGESAGDLHPNDADGGEVHHHGLSADQPELNTAPTVAFDPATLTYTRKAP